MTATHYDLCMEATRWAVHQRWCTFAAPEVDLYGAQADVLALGLSPLCVRIIEVKRTRSDLLADLRERKMQRKYDSRATHTYLALGPDVIAERPQRQVIELTELGLPRWWGVLQIYPESPRGAFTLRRPRAKMLHGDTKPLTKRHVDGLTKSLGRSMTWRLLRGHQHRR